MAETPQDMHVSKPEILFGRLTVKYGLATKEQILDSINEQAKLRKSGKEYHLGQVMAMKGYLSVDHLEMLLQCQHETVLACPECSAEFKIEGYLPGMRLSCRKCRRGTLVKPEQLTAEAPKGKKHRTSTKIGTIGDYVIVKEISRGGMGVVYKARRKDYKRTVALKMLLDEKSSSENEVARFRLEAEAIAKLSHPNIVAVYDLSETDGQYFFAMEFINGESLEDRLEQGKFSIEESARIVHVLAKALAYAHGRGICHRDIKPGNILIEKGTGRVVLTDFGLAVKEKQSRRLTRSGFALGTPAYMAPEQCIDQASSPAFDARTDIYQLGSVLYEMLTGQPPFDFPSPIETLLRKLREDPPPPRSINPEIPPGVERICLKCVQRDIDLRYTDGESLAEDLEPFLKAAEANKKPRHGGLASLLLKVIVILGLLGVVVYCTWRLYLAIVHGETGAFPIIS